MDFLVLCTTMLFVSTAVVFVAKGITLHNEGEADKSRKTVLIGVLAFVMGLGTSVFLEPETTHAPEVSGEQREASNMTDVVSEEIDEDVEQNVDVEVEGDVDTQPTEEVNNDAPAASEDITSSQEESESEVLEESESNDTEDEMTEDGEDGGNFSVIISDQAEENVE